MARGQWHYSLNHDTNDGIPWTDGDVDDLRFESNMAAHRERRTVWCRQGTRTYRIRHRTCWLIGPWPDPAGIRLHRR